MRARMLTTMVVGAAASMALPADSRAAERKAEAEILQVLDDLHDHQRQGMMNVPPADGRLLRELVEEVDAKRVVEIGTSNGYSGIWICLGLRETGGKLTTFEIDKPRAALARENFKRAGVEDLVTLVEGDAHVEVMKLREPIDLLFLDADKAGYIDYLTRLLPLVRPGGLVLAHNTTNLAAALKDYVYAVTHGPYLATDFRNADEAGMAVTVVKENPAFVGVGAGRGDRILGYIMHIPPESPQVAEARHRKVAERRSRVPILVHRGDRGAAPENTLEAYAAAMDAGADGCEIDIRRSKDGVIYLFHDGTLDRTTHGSGKAREKTYYELLQAGVKVSGRAGGETRIPTLTAFLELARQRAMLLHLDIKEPGIQREIARMLDEADMWDHVVHINRGNADWLADHEKTKLLGYKGWWPEGEHAYQEAAMNDVLSKDSDMVFCKTPQAPVRMMKRPIPEPIPMPVIVRAYWTPDGLLGPTSRPTD